MNKTIYIRAEDQALYDRAEAFAKRQRRSLSWLIVEALREYLERHGSPGKREDN